MDYRFNLSSKQRQAAKKSPSRKSLLEQAVILKGVRRTKLQEERRLKIVKKPNFDHLATKNERTREAQKDFRIRNEKLMYLLKTKNTLLNVKADI